MAFRAGNIVASKGYTRAKEVATHVKAYVQRRIGNIQNGAGTDLLLSIYFDLYRAREELDGIRTVPGIAEYAKSQEDDSAYDVGAEFNAMISAIDAATSYIESALPTDGAGWLLERKLSNGAHIHRQFTAAQLSTLAALLQDIDSSIE